MRYKSAVRDIDFGSLDCIRGLAAFYVLLNHARGHLFAGLVEYVTVFPRASWTTARPPVWP